MLVGVLEIMGLVIHLSGTMCQKLQMTFTAIVSYFDDAILKIS